ncbi:MAG: four helix bundle protein [Patescibacteria group bacterium]
MYFLYENLEITNLAKSLIKQTYKITSDFPKEEMFGLYSQLRRAAISVLLNIAEGSGRYYKKEYARFMRNAIASLIELDAGIKISIDLKYIEKDKNLDEINSLIQALFYKSIAFEKSLVGKRLQQTK